jgi:hypothetical protein
MSHNVQSQIEKYRAKLFDLTQYKSISVDKQKANMYQTFLNGILEWDAKRRATKQVLDAESVATIRYPAYLAFSGQIYKRLKKGWIGGVIAAEASTLKAMWKSRGLSQTVMEKILLEVYNIGPWAPPGS